MRAYEKNNVIKNDCRIDTIKLIFAVEIPY